MSFMKIGRRSDVRECAIPNHLAELLKAKEGDYLLIEPCANGVTLRLADSETAAELQLYEECVRRYRNTLQILAEN